VTLQVEVRHGQGQFLLDVAFESAGRLIALFGPSGSGKTTLVNVIAGLVRPQAGRVVVDGRTLVDTAARTFLKPHRRRIGYVFQDARLFPHLTVRQNLLYGRWLAPRDAAKAELSAVVDMLDIGHLLARRPALLSGGEKQRVAIGRALLSAPSLILMDEPLASLDEARKAEILPYIERLRDAARVPVVYVSHQLAEVARLATDIAVLDRGRLAAFGATADILPRLELFAGAEAGEGGAMLSMRVAGQDRAFGITTLRSAAGEIVVPKLDAALGSFVRVRLRARDVMVATQKPAGLSALNLLSGTVASLEAVGDSGADVRIDCAGEMVVARITRLSATRLRLEPGMAVYAVVKTVSVEPAGAAPAGQGSRAVGQ
jgi:molybdate transport system ATP-binding protein